MAISWASTPCQIRSVRGLLVGWLPGSGSVVRILRTAAVGVVGCGCCGVVSMFGRCGVLSVLGMVLFCGCVGMTTSVVAVCGSCGDPAVACCCCGLWLGGGNVRCMRSVASWSFMSWLGFGVGEGGGVGAGGGWSADVWPVLHLVCQCW